MPAQRLAARCVEKPWGRCKLWPGFEQFESGKPVGEIWFEAEDNDLLVKYLFTGDTLSVQVHPSDDQARARGLSHGKDEAWLVLGAEPEATIALGPKHSLEPDELRAAAVDGSIVDMLDWQEVRPGQFIYSPATTLHTMGPGLSLIEVQQNVDATFRLFDFGRTREIHVEEGIAAARLTPFVHAPSPANPNILCEGPKFVVERLTGRRPIDLGGTTALLVPVTGGGTLEGQFFQAGQCWQVRGATQIDIDPEGLALLAYPGNRRL